MTRNHRAALILAGLLTPFATGANSSGCGDIIIGGGGTPDEHPAPAPCGPELHILGVYETSSDHSGNNHPTGAGTVHVERQGSFVLALSSYEPVDWTVTAAPGAVIEKVILNGYHAQSAVVPAGVPVEIHDEGGWLGSYAYAWPSSDGGSDTASTVSAFEALAGRPMTSFHGCYHATSFVLGADLDVTSDCAVDQGYEVTGTVDPEALSGHCDDGEDPCANANGPGSYVAYYCDTSSPMIITQHIDCESALQNCEINTSSNPTLSISCQWNGQVIKETELAPGACDGVSPP
jgi:hypothetical protein